MEDVYTVIENMIIKIEALMYNIYLFKFSYM